MSLVPSWARARAATSIAELSARLLRLALKGLPPLELEDNIKLVYDLASRESSGVSDYPRQFASGMAQAAVAAQNSFCQLSGRAQRTEITGLLVGSTTAATAITIQLNRIGFASAAPVHLTNRPRPTANRPIPLATATTGSVAGIPAGGVVGRVVAGLASIYIPLNIRLGPPDTQGSIAENLEVWAEVVNASLLVMIFGREWDEP